MTLTNIACREICLNSTLAVSNNITIKKAPMYYTMQGSPGSMVKNTSASAGDSGSSGSILGSGTSPGVGNGNLFQCSCLEHFMGRGSWWATDHGVTDSQVQLSTHACTMPCIS